VLKLLSDSREERVKLINAIEEKRGSKVLVYFCADRPMAGSQVANDAVRILYEHLLAIAPTPKIKLLDLYLYSIGGRVEVPWRVVAMLREFCKKLAIIVPYKAYSAATLITLGSDEILMGRKGELGPIDPSLMMIPGGLTPQKQQPTRLGVEDVFSYLTFINEAGLTDQTALAKSVCIIAEKLTPQVLGSIQRARSHIRLVGRKSLALCQPPLEERRIETIVQALTEKMYAHGHGIGRVEAEEIGLQVKKPDADLESLIWNLYLSYEKEFDLQASMEPEGYFPSDNEDQYSKDGWEVACIESTEKLDVFEGRLRMKRIRRQIPSANISINLPLQLPPNMTPQNLPQNIQGILQQLMQNAANQIRTQVMHQLAAQAPVTGVQAKLIGGRWIDRTPTN
jgi:hypothetical protein